MNGSNLWLNCGSGTLGHVFDQFTVAACSHRLQIESDVATFRELRALCSRRRNGVNNSDINIFKLTTLLIVISEILLRATDTRTSSQRFHPLYFGAALMRSRVE